jgi:chromosome partitioning protein
LEKALREVDDDYDYILIDCPPNIYLMTQNALVASKWYVITAIPDHLSTIGLSILQKKVGRIGDLTEKAQRFAGEAKPRPRVAQLGAVIFVKIRIGGSMVTTMHSNMMERISTDPMFTGFCLPAYTTEMIGYGEAAENSLPVWMYGSQNAQRAARKREYERITQEFLRRF